MDKRVLLLAIIQSADRDAANAGLTQAGFQVTHISSVGGFLETGNATLLIGLEHRKMARAVQLLATSCRKRIAFVNTAPQIPGVGMQPVMLPVEAEVGGGTIFVLPLERLVRFGDPSGEITRDGSMQKERGIKLVMAIVTKERSSEIIRALTMAQYRATRISTTGGFLRKGNETVLIGVEANRLDTMLKRIEDIYAARTRETDGTKAYATIFVLDVEQYLHF